MVSNSSTSTGQPSNAVNETAIQTIKIWLKAFIPRNVMTWETVPGNGQHAGKTMLPSPGPATPCYLTDQRDFDSNIDAQARMHSEIEFDIPARKITRELHKCYETIEIDCKTGEETCRQSAKTDDMQFSQFRLLDNGFTLAVKLEGSSRNPCLKVANVKVSPNLDYSGTITITLRDEAHAIVQFEGYIEVYPAFEMYVAVNDGKPHPLFQESVVPGAGVETLLGPPAREISRRIQVTAS
jgi:hypothetical protein